MSDEEVGIIKKKEKEKKALTEQIEDELYAPVSHLEPKEQRYALKKVTSSLSDGEIAKSVGLSDYQRRELEKDEHFQRYLTKLQKRYSDKEIVETERRQLRYIREQMFEEVASRFKDPEKAAREHFGETEEGLIDATQDEKEKFKERFAYNASFKDLINALKKIDKMRRLDEGQATDRLDSNALENRARESFEELRENNAEREFFDQTAEEAINNGVDNFEEFRDQVIDAEFEEVDPEEVDEKENSEIDESEEEIMDEFEIEN